MNELELNDFPLKSYDKIRYADTDRQGHVNNAVFSTFFETGRVEMLYDSNQNRIPENTSYVIASITLDYIAEVTWPGKVEIGTGVLKIGNSSIRLFQRLFQNNICVAQAETVIVRVDDNTGRSKPLDDNAKKVLSEYLLNHAK